MKKLIGIIWFLLCFATSFSQNLLPRAGASNTVADARLQATLNLYIPRYADTTAANAQIGIDSCGAVIFTRDVNWYWVRQCNPKRWTMMPTINGSLVANVYIVDSNHIAICTVNSCDTILVNGIQGPITNITIINNHTILVCGSDVQGDQQLINGTFTGNANGWTLGTGWVYDDNNVTHVVSNVGNLLQAGVLVEASTYYVALNITGTAGTVDVKLDGGATHTFNAGAGDVTFTGVWNNAAGDKIIITPSSDFDGSVTNVSVKPLLPNCDSLQIIPINIPINDTIGVITPIHALDPHTIYIDTVDRTQDGVLLKEAYSYFDDKPEFLTHTAANGYDVLQSVVHGDTTNWDTLNIVCDGFGTPAPQVYWAGITDSLVYGVTSGNYSISCKNYTNPNTLFVLPTASSTLSYFATFYVDTSGNSGVIIGDSSLTPTIPPVDESYQRVITSLLVQPLQTVTDIDTLIIWNTNAHGNEFFVSNSGTTSDTTNTLNVYRFPRSINVTNINVGDRINFTHTVIDVSPYKALVLFIKLKQTIPAGAEIVANWLNGTTFVSGSIRLPINKSNITTYQPISIPLTTFSFTNTNITTLRLNYTNAGAANNLGFYLDFIYLQSGVTPALPSGVIVGYNGVTDKRVNGVDSIKLGGTLVENTTITEGPTFNLTLTGSQANGLGTAELVVNNSGAGKAIFANSIGGATITGQSSGGGTGLVGISASGIGTSGGSTDGVGVQGASINSLGGQFSVQPSSTNTTIPIARLNRLSSGTAANNIAGSLDLSVQTSDGTNPIVNQIITKLTTANTATRTSQLSFTGVNSATTNTLLTLSGNGAAQLNKYGLGNFTGTATYNLSVDASGNLIETTGGGGTTPNLQQVFDVQNGNALLNKADSMTNNTLAGESMLFLSTTNTGATGSAQKVLRVAVSGTNAGGAITYAIHAVNSHDGASSINYGIYGSASGGTTANYGIYGNGTTAGVFAESSGFGSNALQAVSNSATGIAGNFSSTAGGTGIAVNTSTGTPFVAGITSGNNSGIVPMMTFDLGGSAPADGIGFSIPATIANSSNIPTSSLSLINQFTTATAGSEVSSLTFKLSNAGAMQDVFTLGGSGALQLNKYGLGSFTGTPAYSLAVDASGNLIETSGGGNTIYTGDGAYPSSAFRTVDQNGGRTAFVNGNFGIGVDPTGNLFQVSGEGTASLIIDTVNHDAFFGAGNDATGGLSSLDIYAGAGDGGPHAGLYTQDGSGNSVQFGMTAVSKIISMVANGGVTGKFVPRFTTDATNTTPVPDMDSQDMLIITALDADAAFGVPVGTLIQGESLLYRVTADGSPHNFTWDAVFQGGTQLALPATISANETMYIQFVYNTESSKWQITGLTSGL